MSMLENLILLDNSKLIVLDEPVNASYSQYLIAHWLHNVIEKKTNKFTNYFLFSCPRNYLIKKFSFYNGVNYKIHDYFSLDIDSEKANINLSRVTEGLKNSNGSIYVIDCLNTLLQDIGISDTCKFIKSLASDHSQIICIFRRNLNIKNFPSIETFGSIYVQLYKLKNTNLTSNIIYKAIIIGKKTGGSITKSQELVEQNIVTLNLQSKIIKESLKLQTPDLSDKSIIPQSSFRLEMSEQEIKQRESVVLPYTTIADPNRESRILYDPEDIDDLDEEDPDDDLCI